MTGLELIKPRPLRDNDDIGALESQYNISIPPIFKLFCQSFAWKTEVLNGKEFHYYPNLTGGEIIFPYTNLESHLSSTRGGTDTEIDENKVILLANNRFGIFVGTMGDQVDKVLLRTRSIEGSFTVIADNVFEFLRGITDNLSDSAETEDEYRDFMIAMGYEDEDLAEEIEDWKAYKGIT